MDVFYADPQHVCNRVQLAAIECIPGSLKPETKFFGITFARFLHASIMPFSGP